jgi:Cu-Zn family superoxide dismutase
MKNWMILTATGLMLTLALGCSSPKQESAQSGAADQGTAESMPQGAPAAAVAAVCELAPTAGNQVEGTVTFTPGPDGITVRAVVTGLTPGLHGFHIHEFGDCSAPDGSSAGGHLNPDGMPHGGPDSPQRHEGDLGNLEADSTGTAHYERTDRHIALEGETSIIGHAIIVHAQADDFTTQPTGAAGARVACGVIQVATP